MAESYQLQINWVVSRVAQTASLLNQHISRVAAGGGSLTTDARYARYLTAAPFYSSQPGGTLFTNPLSSLAVKWKCSISPWEIVERDRLSDFPFPLDMGFFYSLTIGQVSSLIALSTFIGSYSSYRWYFLFWDKITKKSLQSHLPRRCCWELYCYRILMQSGLLRHGKLLYRLVYLNPLSH